MSAAEPRIRRATTADLDALTRFEHLCFQPWRRSSRASLRRSLASPRQSVWVVDGPGGLLASLVLWHHPHALRVYGVATHPDARGTGIGSKLMAHAEKLARAAGCQRVILEADPDEPGLVAWYEHRGYRAAAHRADFYGAGHHAVRLVKNL